MTENYPRVDQLPLLIVQKGGQTIAVVRDTPAARATLPFSLRSCDVRPVHDAASLQSARDSGALSVAAREWPLRLRLRAALCPGPAGRAHWLLLLPARGAPLATEFRATPSGIAGAAAWLARLPVDAACGLCAASELAAAEAAEVAEAPGALRAAERSDGPNGKAGDWVSERAVVGDSAADVALAVEDFLCACFTGEEGACAPTAVFLPPPLTFPVNVRYGVDALRVAEHDALLLPMRPLLRAERRAKEWATAGDSQPRPPQQMMPRVGQAWERHLLPNIHEDVKKGRAIDGGEVYLVSGSWDYYHYRVDGFKDDGWGCAYRSLQMILSWFQYEGLLETPMPDIRAIQRILSVTDADKMNRADFVGSKDWIGSFEIMIVLQHFIPGLECVIQRMESGSDLDSNPQIQQVLMNHFKEKRACPVMIGGSSYAHTILGIEVNPHTMEAQYLIADPHYSSTETVKKIALNKGHVGWKEASKFFEATSWYNLCIPQVNIYDPR